MSQRLNQNLSRSRTTQETRRGGDKITKNRNAEYYKCKAELLQDQLTIVKAKLAATNVELSRMHKSPQWRLVTIDHSDARFSESGVDGKHCKRCNETFDKPSLLQTHPCWPGHPPGDLPTRCNACGKNLSSHSSLTRHKKKCKPNDRSQIKTTIRRAITTEEAERQGSESETRFDPAKGTELTPPSKDLTTLSQQQLPLTNPTAAITGLSPTHHSPVEQDQGEKGTYDVVDQSYNYTADSVEGSGDQGQAFFLDPFGMPQYENSGYELTYRPSSTEQSQLFTQNPFGDCFSQANYGLASDDGDLQFSQGSFMT